MLHRQFYEFPTDGSIILIFLHTHQVIQMMFRLFSRYKAEVTVYFVLRVVTARGRDFRLYS
jgi:hypothetical protein